MKKTIASARKYFSFSGYRFSDNVLGILWKLAACLGFAFVNSLVRYITGGAGGITSPLPPTVVTFYQNVFGCMVMLPFALKGVGIRGLSTKRPIAHTIRILSGVIGIICLYTAFSKMPMTQAVALQFTGPIFTIIGAKLYLKENIGGYRMLGIVLGIVGATIITRPDKALFGGGMDYKGMVIFLPLISAALFAVAKLAGREMASKGERPEVLALYLLFFMIPVSAMTAVYDWVVPNTEQMLILVVLGVCGCFAHYATAKAYVTAEVIFLTPFGFARLIFTAILGYIIFKEFPDNPLLWYGMIFVVMSVFTMSFGEVKIKRQTLTKEPAS